MRILIAVFGVIGLIGSADAQIVKDPPWNPEHINRLPPDVSSAVLDKCSPRPGAGHYFATYFHDEIHLHYEHFHCDTASFLAMSASGLPSLSFSKKFLWIEERLSSFGLNGIVLIRPSPLNLEFGLTPKVSS